MLHLLLHLLSVTKYLPAKHRRWIKRIILLERVNGDDNESQMGADKTPDRQLTEFLSRNCNVFN